MPFKVMCGGAAGSAIACASRDECRGSNSPDCKADSDFGTSMSLHDIVQPKLSRSDDSNQNSTAPMTIPTAAAMSHITLPFSSRTPTPTPRDVASNGANIGTKQLQPLRIGQSCRISHDAPVVARRSLVQRTHSPKDGISPLSRQVTLNGLGFHKLPAPPEDVSTQIPIFSPFTKSSSKKRRRSNGSTNEEGNKATFFPLKKRRKSPTKGSNPNSPPSNSRAPSPVEKKTDVSIVTVSKGSQGKNDTEVRTVAPTVRGIYEAARILHAATLGSSLAYPLSPPSSPTVSSFAARAEGILAFPTETVYALTTCIIVRPLLRSSSTSSASSASATEDDVKFPSEMNSPSLNRLFHLKDRHGNSTKSVTVFQGIGSDPDPPLLYIHTPSQAREFVQFTKPKTFIIKKSTNGPGSPQAKPISLSGRDKVPAVTFSESREVLDRIINAFWPGPVVIYAKAKMRRVSQVKLPTLHEDGTEGGSQGPDGSVNNDGDEVAYSPVLPTSVLIRGMSKSDSTYYVGMKCPSHPLARRILEEFYNRSNKKMSGGNRRRCRSRVVLGFNATVPISLPAGQAVSTKPPCPTKAMDVCAQLLSPQATAVTSADTDPPVSTTVHVLNGEDKREIFAAPTCQFGAKAFVSLIIDDEARTIRIQKSRDVQGRSSDVLPKDVYLALLRGPSPTTVSDGNGDASSSAGARVIAAVLQRWKVVEEHIEL